MPTDNLHPQVAAIAEARRKLRVSRVLEATALREAALAGTAAVNAGGPVPENRREINLPRPQGDDPIRMVLYEPAGPRGLCVFFHGGGFVICCPETHDKIARSIAVSARCVVASVDYRKAPEHPFPAAYEDALESARWLADMLDTLVPGGSLVLAGDSSGGNLAASAALALANDGKRVAGVVLLYPWLDLGRDSESRRHFGPGDMIIDDDFMDYCTGTYLPGGEVSDPRASPLFADLSGFPPAAVICGTLDPLLSDSERFVQRLRDAGRSVDWRPFAGMPHGFISLCNALDDGQAALDLAVESISRMMEEHA